MGVMPAAARGGAPPRILCQPTVFPSKDNLKMHHMAYGITLVVFLEPHGSKAAG